MTAPMIVWDNRFADATPVASSTASGAAINLADFRPYTSWKPATMPATVTVDCLSAKSADCLAIFNHDLGSKGATVEIRGSTDNFVASNVLVASKHATSDSPFIVNFTSASYRYWRAKLLGCHNLMLWSQTLDNAAWTKTNCTVTANAVTAPDGTLTADKIVEDTTTSQKYFVQGMTCTVGVTYTFSFYAKAGERSVFGIWTPLLDTVNSSFNLANGTCAGVGASIQSVGNGWYRCIQTATCNTTGVVNIFAYLNNSSYLGDGVSGAYVWGVQFEESTNPSTYITTTSTSVTNAPTLSIVSLGTSLPLEIGVPFGFDPLQRTVFGSTNISEQGLPLGKSVLFEQWSQAINLGFVTNTWLRNTFLPAWKAHLRGNPFLFAFDNTTYPNEVYLVESDGNLNTPTVAPDYSGLSFNVKGVALP